MVHCCTVLRYQHSVLQYSLSIVVHIYTVVDIYYSSYSPVQPSGFTNANEWSHLEPRRTLETEVTLKSRALFLLNSKTFQNLNNHRILRILRILITQSNQRDFSSLSNQDSMTVENGFRSLKLFFFFRIASYHRT